MYQISYLFCLYYCFKMSEKCVSLDLLILVWYYVFNVMLKSMSWQSYGTYIVCIVYWRLLFYNNFLDIILELPQNVSVLYIKFMMFMKLLLILLFEEASSASLCLSACVFFPSCFLHLELWDLKFYIDFEQIYLAHLWWPEKQVEQWDKFLQGFCFAFF